MNSSALFTIIGPTGICLIIVAGIDAIRSRRKFKAETKKLGAEATELITQAASDVVANIRHDNAELRQRLSRVERHSDALRDALQVHAAWDYNAARKLEEHGIAMPPPPPLYPKFEG